MPCPFLRSPVSAARLVCGSQPVASTSSGERSTVLAAEHLQDRRDLGNALVGRSNWEVLLRSEGLCGRRLGLVPDAGASTAAPADEEFAPYRGAQSKKLCETLIAGERALTAMMVTGDTSIVERLFADDAVWSLGDGTRWTKGEAVAALRKAPRMTSSHFIRADIRQFGTIAIVLWNEGSQASATSPEELTYGTDTWMLRAGRWQIIASQEAHALPLKAR
jgi:hypothetical protein